MKLSLVVYICLYIIYVSELFRKKSVSNSNFKFKTNRFKNDFINCNSCEYV